MFLNHDVGILMHYNSQILQWEDANIVRCPMPNCNKTYAKSGSLTTNPKQAPNQQF